MKILNPIEIHGFGIFLFLSDFCKKVEKTTGIDGQNYFSIQELVGADAAKALSFAVNQDDSIVEEVNVKEKVFKCMSCYIYTHYDLRIPNKFVIMKSTFKQGGFQMEYVIAVLVIIAILLLKVQYDNKQTRQTALYFINKRWGAIPDRELTNQQLEAISCYYKATKREGLDVDDITWNDVSMDEIFARINNTQSSIGEEYLYAMLRKLEYNKEVLEERERMISYYQEHEKERIEMQTALGYMGKLTNISFYKQFDEIKEVKTKRGKHILHCVAMVLSLVIAAVCVFMEIGSAVPIFLVVAVIGMNIVQYYRRKAEIERYYYLFVYILKLLYSVDVILSADAKENIPNTVFPDKQKLKEISSKFKNFRKKAKFISGGNNMGGGIDDIFMDYIRMLFHIDLIMFDSMIEELGTRQQEIMQAYEILGKIDSAIAIASFRISLEGDYCIPKLYEQAKPRLELKDMYHPLIEEPVKNSISQQKSVLITGSNASGKSTFIKTVAINAILAQTIHTCMCREYTASFFTVYSSMALTDNLLGRESYYIVEIKSLKRILDRANDKIPTLCFVDEVLRGTNTLERIAASSQILKYLSELNVFCFAATHDIELTYILESYFENYHFQEEVKDNEVVFNYELKEGRATSRNAIQLLKMIGYPDSVIQKASDGVTHFMETGVWETIARE